jgi:hypothetical protein
MTRTSAMATPGGLVVRIKIDLCRPENPNGA